MGEVVHVKGKGSIKKKKKAKRPDNDMTKNQEKQSMVIGPQRIQIAKLPYTNLESNVT